MVTLNSQKEKRHIFAGCCLFAIAAAAPVSDFNEKSLFSSHYNGSLSPRVFLCLVLCHFFKQCRKKYDLKCNVILPLVAQCACLLPHPFKNSLHTFFKKRGYKIYTRGSILLYYGFKKWFCPGSDFIYTNEIVVNKVSTIFIVVVP